MIPVQMKRWYARSVSTPRKFILKRSVALSFARSIHSICKTYFMVADPIVINVVLRLDSEFTEPLLHSESTEHVDLSNAVARWVNIYTLFQHQSSCWISYYSRRRQLWTTQPQYSTDRVGLIHSVESDRRAALRNNITQTH